MRSEWIRPPTAEAADGVEAIQLARALRPDVVLMDVRMPRLDGINATRQLLTLDPAPAIVVMTTFDLDEYVYQALRAGASGFLLKTPPKSTCSPRCAPHHRVWPCWHRISRAD
jgi:DNA-binding NarL/FixJ family response regulator